MEEWKQILGAWFVYLTVYLICRIDTTTSDIIFLQIEDQIVKSISEIVPQDIKNLLEKYNESIKNSLTGFNIDISKVAMTVNENPLSKQTDYNFRRDWGFSMCTLHCKEIVFDEIFIINFIILFTINI
jgi:hypothetical protein